VWDRSQRTTFISSTLFTLCCNTTPLLSRPSHLIPLTDPSPSAMFFARSLLIASAIGGALAQINGLSTQCQNTILAVGASPQALCLNPSGLLQVILEGTTGGSVVTPIDTWLRGLCALGPCSNDNIAAIVTNITSGCATDLQPFLGNVQPGSLSPLIEEIYPTIRKAVCLADASDNNQLCVTQTLSNLQTASGGTLTLDGFLEVLSTVLSGTISSVNGDKLCTPCVKQIYNVAKGDFPAIFGQGTPIATDFQTNCGTSFVDGASDPNIIETANNTTPNSSGSSNGGCGQPTGQQALLSTFLLSLLALTV
jgi:hypothetical protein